jgi:hypothetical protein
MIETYAMESALLRARKLGEGSMAAEMTSVFLRDAMGRIEIAARDVLPVEAVRHLAAYVPVDAIALRRAIADRLLQAGRYVL